MIDNISRASRRPFFLRLLCHNDIASRLPHVNLKHRHTHLNIEIVPGRHHYHPIFPQRKYLKEGLLKTVY